MVALSLYTNKPSGVKTEVATVIDFLISQVHVCQ